jgi:hypothetical protein
MKSEQVYPVARESTNSLTGDTIQFDEMEIPEGKYVKGVSVDLAVTTSGSAGTGTDYTARIIKEIEIKNEDGKRVFHAHGQGGIGILALFAAAVMGAIGLTPHLVVNDDVCAGNSTYYGNWKVMHGIVGSKFKVAITFEPVSVLAGYSTSPTGITLSAAVAFELSDKQPVPGLLKGYRLASQTKYTDAVIAALIGIDNVELSTVFNGLSFGGQTLNTAQIKMLESMTNYKLRGAGAAGSQNPVPGVTAPDSANDLYAALFEGEDVKTLNITCTSSTLLVGKLSPYSEEE